MSNNVVLDVFIGLVLIYLLYSLFITIIGEMVATWMSLRSRILRVAMEKMLNDERQTNNTESKKRKSLWSVVQRYFLKEFEDFKYSLAGKFYASPAIKYLSDNGGERKTFFSQTKPSYISADKFAETLIQLLKDKGMGATDIEKVKFCLQFNTHHIGPATLKNLRDHVENSGADTNVLKERLKNWYNETMDRATGWYKRRLQLILFWLGLIVATVFNVDTIRIAKILSKDKEARSQLVAMGIELLKDSARYSDFVYAKSDTLRGETILDSGYAKVTKDMDEANLVLGLGWPLNDLEKNDKKYIDSEKDSAAFKFIKEYQSIFGSFHLKYNGFQNELRRNKKYRDSLSQKMVTYKIDTAVFKLREIFEPGPMKSVLADTIKTTTLLIDSTANRLSIADNLIKTDSTQLAMITQSRKEATRQINANTAVKSLLIDSIVNNGEGKSLIVYSHRPYSTPEKICYVLAEYNPFRLAFWSFVFSLQFLGLFITALMLSLGAPFWFDLLKKLVSIRGTGVKPEEKKSDEKKSGIAPPIENPAILAFSAKSERAFPPAGDICDEAINIYGSEIMRIPGVKSVFKVFDKIKKTQSIQINVIDDATQKIVEQTYKKLEVGDNTVIPVIFVSGIPLTQQSHFGEISNASGKNGFGATGCVLQDKQTKDLHILSCWHVMKGDMDYDNDDSNTTILDYKQRGLASRWAGGIAGAVDFGIAECFNDRQENNQKLKSELDLSQLQYRAISDQDINNQISIKYYDWSAEKERTGMIYTSTPFLEVHYKDKIRTVEDILVLTNPAGDSAISQPGNSGSIVFDENGFAIAMIIAGDFFYSYAVKLSNIFSIHTEMEIFKA